MRETRSCAPRKRVKGTHVGEATVGECGESDRSTEKLTAVSGDTEGSQGKGCCCRDWKELVGQEMGFQTEGTMWCKGKEMRKHTSYFGKQSWSGVNLKLCINLILREYLLRVRPHSKHFRGIVSYLLHDL